MSGNKEREEEIRIGPWALNQLDQESIPFL